MSGRQITAKAVHKLGLHPVPDKPDTFVLEIQVTGETAHYALSRTDLRKFSDALSKEVAKLDAAPTKPN
jgi:hypothetical protein